MSHEKRNEFTAKVFLVGLAGIAGIASVGGGFQLLSQGPGNAVVGLIAAGFGVGLLVAAWKIMGE